MLTILFNHLIKIKNVCDKNLMGKICIICIILTHIDAHKRKQVYEYKTPMYKKISKYQSRKKIRT